MSFKDELSRSSRTETDIKSDALRAEIKQASANYKFIKNYMLDKAKNGKFEQIGDKKRVFEIFILPSDYFNLSIGTKFENRGFFGTSKVAIKEYNVSPKPEFNELLYKYHFVMKRLAKADDINVDFGVIYVVRDSKFHIEDYMFSGFIPYRTNKFFKYVTQGFVFTAEY